MEFCMEKCPARLRLNDNGDCYYSVKFCGHSHDTTSEKRIAKDKFMNDIKEACSNIQSVGNSHQYVTSFMQKHLSKSNFIYSRQLLYLLHDLYTLKYSSIVSNLCVEKRLIGSAL